MTIREWQQKINQWAEEKGWNNDLNESPDSIGKQLTNMHSELSEAWEEIKNGHKILEVYGNNGYAEFHAYGGVKDDDDIEPGVKPEGFPIELADCVIRILHTCEFYGIDLEKMMEIKQKYNATRAYRHGGKRA